MDSELQKKRISELPESVSPDGLYTIGVNSMNESVRVPIGNIIKSMTPTLISEDEFDNLVTKDDNKTYFVYEED